MASVELKERAIALFTKDGNYVHVYGSTIGKNLGKGSCSELLNDGFISTNDTGLGNHQYFLTDIAIQFAASHQSQKTVKAPRPLAVSKADKKKDDQNESPLILSEMMGIIRQLHQELSELRERVTKIETNSTSSV